MSISTRISIAWGPSFTHSEPTDTLVLTAKTYFVDQRLLKPDNPSTPQSVSWAFAGTSTSHPVPDTPNHRRGVWTHLVSSVPFAKGEKPSDEGILCPHPDHPNDPEVWLETGSMVNPETGIVTEYEEVWRDRQPDVGSEVTVWEYGDDETGPENRGFLAVVGEHALGVGRVDGAFWTWRALKNGEAGDWRVVFEVYEGTGGRKGFKLLEFQLEKAIPGITKVEDENKVVTWTCREAWAVKE
ncbi:hypothetical protein TWF694_006693 [Orbilia ellipsospora]|uniref:Protein HRI1 n=1 Tax=Orbilia ellipsospora TaxID=2528407 RepID=A0AAV9XPB2_9PEZI